MSQKKQLLILVGLVGFLVFVGFVIYGVNQKNAEVKTEEILSFEIEFQEGYDDRFLIVETERGYLTQFVFDDLSKDNVIKRSGTNKDWAKYRVKGTRSWDYELLLSDQSLKELGDKYIKFNGERLKIIEE